MTDSHPCQGCEEREQRITKLRHELSAITADLATYANESYAEIVRLRKIVSDHAERIELDAKDIARVMIRSLEPSRP
jgi:uncharacterized coiled-coil DUF342 family protein